MKAREKLLITISLLACGIAIGVFALVSLGHFIYSPARAPLPVVGKMYQSTVQQVALLEPVPVPPVSQPASNNNPPTPPSDEASLQAAEQASANAKKNLLDKNHGQSKKDRDELRKALAALFGLL